MVEFDIQAALKGIDEKLTDARDRVIRVEARFDAFESRYNEHERRLGEIQSQVDALADEKVGADAVERYRSEAVRNRRWLYASVCTSIATAISFIGILFH